jgi:hypothetical protein
MERTMIPWSKRSGKIGNKKVRGHGLQRAREESFIKFHQCQSPPGAIDRWAST